MRRAVEIRNHSIPLGDSLMFRKPRKTIGKLGFKVDKEATAARQPQIMDGTLVIDARLGTFSFLDKRSFISTTGHELLYGEDMSKRRREVWQRDLGRCMLIASPRCRGWASWKDGEVDHIISRGKGGSEDISNLRWTCKPCHRFRHVHPRWGEKG